MPGAYHETTASMGEIMMLDLKHSLRGDKQLTSTPHAMRYIGLDHA